MECAAFQIRVVFFEFETLGVVALVFFGGVARGRFAFFAGFRAFERNDQPISLLCSHSLKLERFFTVKNEAQIYGNGVELPNGDY
jgi:hypothetical protein